MTISRSLFLTYRVLALTVGVFLLAGTLAFLTKHTAADGSSVQDFARSLWWIWVLHGWLYIGYVITAFVLARAAGFPVPRVLVLFVAGLIPLLMFFVEHRTVRDLRATHPELA